VSNDSTLSSSSKGTLGDRIRSIAAQLREEDTVQIKATSRILGAAAKLAENHDRLIDEVVDMVQEDLAQKDQGTFSEVYTVEQLKQQFKRLSDAKAHFGIRAKGWQALVDKLNNQTAPSSAKSPSTSAHESYQDKVIQRIELIERDMQTMRKDLTHVMELLASLLEKSR
jgi:hypothetical protein